MTFWYKPESTGVVPPWMMMGVWETAPAGGEAPSVATPATTITDIKSAAYRRIMLFPSHLRERSPRTRWSHESDPRTLTVHDALSQLLTSSQDRGRIEPVSRAGSDRMSSNTTTSSPRSFD